MTSDVSLIVRFLKMPMMESNVSMKIIYYLFSRISKLLVFIISKCTTLNYGNIH